jgi:transposase-like protein
VIGHGAKFDRKKDAAIAALLSQRNIDEAAKSVGISPQTLLRWMKQIHDEGELFMPEALVCLALSLGEGS